MPPPSRDVSVPGLIKSLADDVTHLFAQEVALAKTEVSSAVKDIKAGVLSLAIGLGVLFAGFIVLLGAAVAGLALVMETWLAALIVGGVVAIIGVVLLMKAKNSLNPDSMVPNRTIESLKKDEEMVRRTVS
jgi:predicted phage tail protein